MLTPKCRPRDFRLRAPPNSPKKCLCRLKPDLRGRNQAGIRGKFDGLVRDRKLLHINDLCWLCSQSAANCSPPANSLIRGKIQGISSISGPWCVLRPSNLNRLVAKFPTQQNREFNRENSEFFLRNREAYADKSEDDDGASDGGAKLFAEPP